MDFSVLPILMGQLNPSLAAAQAAAQNANTAAAAAYLHDPTEEWALSLDAETGNVSLTYTPAT